ncbi:tetratricopeptide repeat protein [Xenophilus azovorans]|uniref:tetratricopeptide repeat protein n=1 Tax=Xenophilus azovorans TaxID=151755 RepID=UPI00056F03C8|nr:tetratricopeptide repeat protein [Xenophilus azovorans]
MLFSPRRYRLAAALATVATLGACAQTTTAPEPSPPPPSAAAPVPAAAPAAVPTAATRTDTRGDAGKNKDTPEDDGPARPSAMTAQLFYEVLVGELNATGGDPGEGFEMLLDAARRTREPALFRRAAEVAVLARSPEAALTVARLWREALPDAREARRLELQVLIVLGRLAESEAPLRDELAATPVVEHPALMAMIVRHYSRAADKKLAASVIERALADDLRNPATAALAWTTVGRLRMVAGDAGGALDAARKGQAADPDADAPVGLALDLMETQPEAEAVVKRYLASPKALPEARIAYARALAVDRRYADASAELQALTQAKPELPEPWLLLGSLQAQARQDTQAEASAKRYLELATQQSDADDRRRGQTQAYILLAQLAERRKDYADAEQWLTRIEGGDQLPAARSQRALLLARQGKLAEARELIRGLPARNEAERRQKLLAEVQLLRDAKDYQSAYDMLARASTAAPEDGDLLYDQAMMAEKLNRLDDMERLLRRLIQLKPDNQNAYNALGYAWADRNMRLPEARELILKAVALAPDDPFIADSLGWVEYRLGNVAEARRILEAAYGKRPDPEIGAHLGEVLWASGQRDRAVKVWKEAVLADAENETLQETLKRLRVKL